jgi:hypothetical protein
MRQKRVRAKNQGKKGGDCTVLRHYFGGSRQQGYGGADNDVFCPNHKIQGELMALLVEEGRAGGAFFVQGK